ncbi:DNA methylase [Galbibacter marinus]|uniref:Methyltransferase n=1 Tax=Galbibacter marinus TaxID=555500 RepID=K2QN20_9FLAO|nr:DNA modification methylase [Galbibacter marinus]EKF56227.1 DNA methylase [Galbibacter marinus]
MSTELLEPLEWHTTTARVADLVPYEYNPRILTEERKEKLKESLSKFNLAEIPAVNTDNKIIAGHQRVKLLMELGRQNDIIDVRMPNRSLTEKEFKEYNITSNVQIGYWDKDVLDEVFADINLEALGLNLDEVFIPDDLIPEELKQEAEDPNFQPEIPKDPISKEGDLYEMVSTQKNLRHRIICGDSTIEDTFKKLLGKEKINCTVTDPPYNVNYQGGSSNNREGIKNDHQESESFYSFLKSFFEQSFKYSEQGSPIYVFHADTEGVNFRKSLVDSGFKFSQCLIWKKNSIVLSRQDYHWQHEPCLYGWKEGVAHLWNSDRKQSTILEFDKPLRSDDHPTMKPIDLISYCITNSSKQKNIVFDGFLGSGSTLIGCELHWRNCRAIELDPRYVDVGVKRYVKYMTDNSRKFEVYKNGKKLTKDDLNKYQ